MTLSAGSRLGPYEIHSPLGAGGMGEVYRARDARLGREVAIKVLPAALSADPERLKRFEREARAASSLNHPNIVTIYDIGSDGGVSYIAMELVKGEPLRAELAGGAVPVRQLLQIGAQIAEGLAKAHAAGIVHRDLKPENVMVTEDGHVKILDFGLAKLTQPEASGSHLTQGPTVSGGTEEGVILGTVGYMSPEQATGGTIDYRSDQFSLGSILYEMATGRRAFHRASAPQTLTAIIQDEPEPITEINPKVPVPMRWLIERCLAKQPKGRYTSTDDLAKELATVRERLSEATSAVQAEAVARPRRGARSRWLLWGLAALAGLSLAILAGRRLGRTEPAEYQQLTFRRGTILSARFASNGQAVVYGAAWNGKPFQLFTTTLEGPESRALDMPDADILSVSASGEMAISLGRRFHRTFYSKGTLAQVSLSGSSPRPLLEDVEWADWLPDGKTLAIVRELGGKDRLECPAGHVLYETPGWISDMRVSPDGERFAFFDHRDPVDPRGDVAVVDRQGVRTSLVQLSVARLGLAWSPRGDEIWFSGTSGAGGSSRAGTLYAVSLSGKRRLIARVPGSLKLHDISRSGRVLLGRETQRVGMMGLVPGEATEKDISWFDSSTIRAISPDGRTVLFFEGAAAGGESYYIYVGKTDGSKPIRVGDGTPYELSPDGTRVLGMKRDLSPPPLVIYPVGPGETQVLPAFSLQRAWANWFPDGKRILSAGSEPGRGRRLYIEDLGGGPPRAISGEGVTFAWGALSPDGSLAAARNPDGTLALYPLSGGSPRAIPGLAADDEPISWTDDGRALYSYRRGQLPARVERVDVATGRRTLWRELMPFDPAGVTGFVRIRITPDGKYYAYSFLRALSDLYLVDGLK